MKHFIVVRDASSNWESDTPTRQQPLWDEHAAFMDALFDQGAVMLGGPFADGSGALLIMLAEDAETVEALLRNDPWEVQDIQVTSSVKEWTIFLDAREKPV